jgi:exopolysaccharide biosynthesis polyprenyl glycosylphosphotransferase
MALAWLTTLLAVGAYDPTTMGAGTTEYRRVLTASTMTAGVIGVGSYLLQYPLSRGLFFLTFLVGIPLLLASRYVLRRLLHRTHERGRLLQSVVLVGAPAQVDEVARVLRREKWLGYDIMGAIVPPAEGISMTTGGVPVLGSTTRTDVLAREWDPDIILFVGGAVNSAQEMRRAAWSLESSGARIMLVPSLTDVASDRIQVRPAAGLPLMELQGPATNGTPHVLKRAFDLVGASAILVLASPVLAATALAVKLHDGGPVLYRQTRSGRDGRPFGCLKFRSMVVGADQVVNTVKNQHSEEHVLFKSKDDPRITPPGRFIRRFSIDELPQLFNVLEGSMSLVGPRPPLPSEVARYTADVHRRLAVRPGMTGLWQVSGRSDLSWDDTVRLDLYYVDNWSVLRDVSILVRTIHAVLSSRGAY